MSGVTHSGPPSPGGARTIDELVTRLRELRAWAGLSEREVHRRVMRARRARGVPELPSYDTVHRCFQLGRTRLNVELLTDIAHVLLGDEAAGNRPGGRAGDGAGGEWRLAHARIVGEVTEAAVVTVLDTLPDDLPVFTGRRLELRSLLAPRVGVIEGMAGIGKTALAVRAAHELRRQGRIDATLWVNLRGYAPDLPPADPAAVLEGFLRRLGMSADRVRALDLAGRAREFRTRLATGRAGGRVLVVLDNAVSAEQVRLLLPDRNGLALITSRNRVTDLPGARRLRLEVFSPGEALELLCRTTGADRIEADPETAGRIASSVGHLPLALGVVASRIRSGEGWTLADHLERLNDHRARLTFDDGVEPALRLSYEGLDPDCQRLFRLLPLHPGPDLDAHAAAALAGSDPDTARRWLSTLFGASLLRRPAPGRYEFHDLVRIYATGRAHDRDPARERREALTRLLDYQLHAAARAMDHYAPHERHLRPRPSASTPVSGLAPVALPPLGDRRAATAWLDAERPGLVGSALHPAEREHVRPGHAAQLSAILTRYLDTGGHYQEAEALHGHAARTAAEPQARAQALARLGAVAWRTGRYPAAADAFRRALALFGQAGDRVGEGWMLGNLGEVEQYLGHFSAAGECFGAALDIAREVGRAGRAADLGPRGVMYEPLGRYPKSYGDGEHGETALAMGREILAIARAIGDRLSEGNVLGSLGSIERQLGRHAEGAANLLRSLRIARETGNHLAEVEMLNELGTTLRETGAAEESLRHHEEAADRAAELGDRYQLARALDGAARCHALRGDRPAARTQARRALALFTELGTPEAGEAAERLRSLGPTS